MDLPTNLAFNFVDCSFMADIDFGRIGEIIEWRWPDWWFPTSSSTAKNRGLPLWAKRVARGEVVYSMRRAGA